MIDLDTLILTVTLGITSSFCPISLAFLLPFVPRVLNGATKRNILNSGIFTLGVIGVIVPISYTLLHFLNIMLEGKILHNIIVSCIAIFMGLWSLRIIKVSRYGRHLKRIRKLTKHKSNSPFYCGVLYGIITIARIAPLYVTMLFLVSTIQVVLGVIYIAIYSFLICLPMFFLGSIMSGVYINILPKYSKLLDFITGSILITIGLYYMVSALFF